MINLVNRLIPISFYLLLFFVPLVVFPKSSELFEFNKTVLTYAFTIIIAVLWLLKMVINRKILFRRTILDLPLLIFLSSQVLSTLTTIDTRSSILGYYSRFHGGLASSFSYSLLYWAYVANMNRKKTMKLLYIIISSAIIVSIYGILQHFGIDKDIWVQDVQARVFSSLGQPNWLAAWLVALFPITWALALSSKFKVKQSLRLRHQSSKLTSIINNFWSWQFLSVVFFLTLLFTKSRSGIFGFGVAYIVFWLGYLFTKKRNVREPLIKYVSISAVLFFITVLVGSPWTPSLSDFVNKNRSLQTSTLPDIQKPQGPALAVGGSESGEIRKIVWSGAIDVWKNYPILGSGLETFAFSYYNFRPLGHNLVSEWDYLYNKAHNEYLNIAATTGSIGLLTYTILVLATIYLFILGIRKKHIFSLAFLSGYISILITNFFGFSVVPVGLQFFLYPAFAITLQGKRYKVKGTRKIKINPTQKVAILIIALVACYLLLAISKYWYADLLYARGKLENDSDNFVKARLLLTKAVNFSERESIFWDELSQSSTGIALALYSEEEIERAQEFADSAIVESGKSVQLSPANVNLRRNRASMFIKLSVMNSNYLINARDTLLKATTLAPTDAKLFYNLGLAYIRTGEIDKAIETLENTIEMKSNYRNARFALALVLIDEGNSERAMKELEYILEYIGTDDSLVRQELEELKESI